MDYPKSIPGVGLVDGGFIDENPVAGTPGSLIPAAWGNSVTQEILNAIKAAGLTPDESKTNQLATAIGALVDFTKLKNTPTTLAGYGITDAVGRLLAVRQIETVGITVYKPNPRARRIRVRLVGAGGSGADVNLFRRVPKSSAVVAGPARMRKACMTSPHKCSPAYRFRWAPGAPSATPRALRAAERPLVAT